MCILARRVKRPFDGQTSSVRRASRRGSKLPMAACHSACFVHGLRKLDDVIAGVLERDEFAPKGYENGIAEGPVPSMLDRPRQTPSSLGGSSQAPAIFTSASKSPSGDFRPDCIVF